MGILYPRITLRSLVVTLGYAGLAALIAGLYGILHDQITYSISPEYFTRLKFAQFHYADFGLPPRVFVAEIGFLATWWVGFIAGWFIARVTVPAFPPALVRQLTIQGFAIIFVSAFVAALAGYAVGLLLGANADFSMWQGFATRNGVQDLRAFVRVAYIHNASYLGGFIGLIIAIGYLRRIRAAHRAPFSK